MRVHNEQPCTLVIGDVRIASGETKAISEDWEARVIQLVDAKALRADGGAKSEDRPSRAMTPAEIFASMSPAEQRAAIAQVRATEITVTGAASPAEVSEPANDKMPAGAPADFATCHVNKALAFVRKCEDVDLLTALGNDETRTTVLQAIIDRCEVLEPKAN